MTAPLRWSVLVGLLALLVFPQADAPVDATTGTVGAAPLGSTSYSIPEGAVYVAPAGTDDADCGPIGDPCRTIDYAADRVADGGTVVARGGVYRENVAPGYADPITLQSYNGEVVWLDGTGLSGVRAFHCQNAGGTRLLGVGVRDYPAGEDWDAAVMISECPDSLIENVYAGLNGNTAITVTNHSDRTVVRHTTSRRNGMRGYAIHDTADVLFEWNLGEENNQDDFGVATPAGVKFTKAVRPVVQHNVMRANLDSTGFWFDISCEDCDQATNTTTDAVVVHNISVDNGRHGIFYEVSLRGIIASNVTVGNTRHGLYTVDSNDVRFWNNTSYGNGEYQLYALKGVRYDLDDVEMVNNVVGGPASTSAFALMGARDSNSPPTVSAADYMEALDFNAYWRPDASSPNNVGVWGDPADNWCTTLSAFQTESGMEANSDYDQSATLPWMTDPDTGDWRAPSGSPVGTAPPADILTALGVGGWVGDWPVGSITAPFWTP